jgi:hypothetical protein
MSSAAADRRKIAAFPLLLAVNRVSFHGPKRLLQHLWTSSSSAVQKTDGRITSRGGPFLICYFTTYMYACYTATSTTHYNINEPCSNGDKILIILMVMHVILFIFCFIYFVHLLYLYNF